MNGVLDGFETLSPPQRCHAKTYVTGLVVGRNKTVTGIVREVLSANSDRALNKFLTEYDWDQQEFNHECLEKFQKHGETRWSQDGYTILDDTITENALRKYIVDGLQSCDFTECTYRSGTSLSVPLKL